MSMPGPFAGPSDAQHPFGLPPGTVRGFMSLLICSFFWIVLLVPENWAFPAPLGHFVLLFLVFLAFAEAPIPHDRPFLPWLFRFLFVGGSIAVLIYTATQHPGRINERLTPDASELRMWPTLLGLMAGGFGAGLFIRFVLGRNTYLFQTLRAWTGVISILLLLAETVYQFGIRQPGPPAHPDALNIWEGIIITFVAAYFGTRA